MNPSIWNPSIWNTALDEQASQATDVTWTVRNDGNATAAYSFNLLADQIPADHVFQLMVYRVYTTPVAEGCELTEEGQQETLVNIIDPDFSSPDLLDPNTSDPDVATFYLEPGEEVFITLRVWDPDSTDDVVFYPETVQPAVVAQGVNTADALAGETQQPYAIPDISVPTTTTLTDSRAEHTSTVLPDGTILIAGGFNGTDDVLSSAELYDPATRTFDTISGGMNAARSLHTATVLEDGTVLLVGGSSGATGTGAEIYDPEDKSFNAIDDPNVMRSGHRAIRLVDGRVLITGGNQGLTTVSSAEVYDPSTGDFTLVGPMGAARWAHSATLLTTGEVLVAGGYGGGATDLDTAELFDPTLNSFSDVPGTMSDPRRFHSATLLPDGTVLLAGGLFDSSLVANDSADIYDRATNSLSPTSDMVLGRAAHSATLMADGTVLLAGGWSWISGTMEIFSHIEAYDWSTGTFAEKGQLTIPRVEHAATRLTDGKVLITGGTTYSTPMTEGTTSSELYVPAEKAKFKKIGDMATPRLYHTVTTLLGGDVIIVGGLDEDSNGIATIERFSPATSEITTVATMPEARMFHSATLLDDGTVLIAGGSPDDGVNVLATALIYDPSDDSVNLTTGDLGTARYAHAAVRLQDGRVLLAAGTSTGGLPLSNTEIYDPATGTFSPSDSLATARATGGASVLLDDGRVLIAGGRTNWAGVTDAFQVWDPATETFGSEGAMNEPRRSHRSTLLHDGTVLVAGGRSDTGWLDSAEIFDPTTDTFDYTAGSMQLRRGSQAQVLLPSGEVLLAGGIKPGGILLSYAEIYDPVTQTFRLTDALTGHNSGTRPTSLADGRVLIAGGMSLYGPMGLVPTTAVEVYNPWDLTGSGKAAFTAQPKNIPIGGLVSPRVQVAVFDRTFTPIPSTQVSLRLENAFGGAGTTWDAWTNDNGIATFDDVWFDRLGPGRRLIAEATTPDGLLSTDPSVPFEVLPLVVTTSWDDGPGSLRRAIENANRNLGYHDTINFGIVGTGLHQIDLASELPTLSEAMTIDGSTQAGYADTPLIRIDGSGLPPDGVALRGGGDDVELRALMITGAPGWGVRSVGASSLTIEDCFVGTDGSSPLGNRVGLEIRDGSGHLLSGNVVSGNVWDGIIIVGASNSTFSNNAIGTDPSGSVDIGNGKVDGGSGLVIDNSHNNTISDNIISGSSYHGIDLKSGSTFNTIVGNTIGLNAARDATIPNEQNGIHARWSVANNTIGGINDGDGNVIAGNGVNGIIVEDAVGPHTIQGNWVGTNPSYGTGLGNGERGISIRYSDDTVIGGADAAAGNVSMWNVTSGIQIYGSTGTYVEGNHIAGNGGTGIIIDAGSTLTTVVDNFIGTDATGTLPVGNTLSGVYLLDSSGNTIGGPGGRNIIAANRRGVFVTGNDNTIENNYIGTDVTGSIDLGNDEDGAWILGYNNVILGNLVSGNGRDGVSLAYGAGLNRVEDNRIGTAADGVSPLPNTGSGVKVDWNSSDNQIEDNTIAHNGGAGVEVISGTGNTIDSNSIFANTLLGIDLGGDGVTPNDSGDGDTGPNELVNYPDLFSAVDNGTNTAITGELEIRAADETYLLQFYANDSCDPSNYGEGQDLLFSLGIVPADSGTISLNIDLLPTGLLGRFLTATVTSSADSNSTSEFSNCVEVVSSIIPLAQRSALIALFNSTGGPSWTDNSGWLGPAGTECSWFGVTCDLGDTTVVELDLTYNNLLGTIPPELEDLNDLQILDLRENQLSGTIPAELGNLSELQELLLGVNQLTGEIPPQLGNLNNLEDLSLNTNQLTGSIPPELELLSSLQDLSLFENHLTGSIPPELGNLTSMRHLWLGANKLTGPIPVELLNLTSIRSDGFLFHWNALYTTDPDLALFIDSHSIGGGVFPPWPGTQTVAPTDLAAGFPASDSITLSWSPITYTADSGGYEILYSILPGGPYASYDTTVDKTVSSIVVDGLAENADYYFKIRSITEPHVFNANRVVSEDSAAVAASTLKSLVVTTNALPNGFEGSTYSQTLTASGGVGTFAWSVAPDPPAPGLALSPGGVISGTPTTAGAYPIIVQVNDGVGLATMSFILAVNETEITFLTEPTDVVAGQTMPLVRVRVTDGGGTPIAGATVNLNLGTTPCADVLPWAPLSSSTNGSGYADFSTISIGSGGWGWTLEATYGSNIGTSQPFDVEGFCSTGSLSVARGHHSSVLLPSGKVLLSGGTGPLSSTETFDPANGTFSAGGAMSIAREDHDSVALPGGDVLIVGYGGGAGPAVGDIFDSATSSLSSTADSSQSDTSTVTANLVTTGKVLVVGSYELYDPATDDFTASAGAPVIQHTYGHTATNLANGDLLIAGGELSDASLSTSPEIYDPDFDSFSNSSAAMSTARLFHTSTLLPDGNVLMVGGTDTSPLTTLSSAEIYNPRTDTINPTDSLNYPRLNHSATRLPSGKVLISGGIRIGDAPLSSAEIYDPVTGTFSYTGPLGTHRHPAHATALKDGSVLVTGGSDTTSADIFYPAGGWFYQTARWARQSGSTLDDIAHGISADSSGVYVAGLTIGVLPGQTSAGSYDAFVRKYDHSGIEIWTRQFGTSGSDRAFAIAVDASGVYVAGTANGTLPSQTSAGGSDAFVRKYDHDGEEIWTRQFGTAEDERANAISVGQSGIYVAGSTNGSFPGYTSSGLEDAFVRRYDTLGNETWTRQFGTSSNDSARAISLETAGVFVAGSTTAALPGQTHSGLTDAFVRGYDHSGTEIWTRQFGTSSSDSASSVAVDTSGVYVAGDTGGVFPGHTSGGGADAFVRKYDLAGTEEWTRQFGGADYDSILALTVDASQIYVGGGAHEALPGQTSSGGDDAFVRIYSSDGNEVWTHQFGSAGEEYVYGISTGGMGTYVTGITLGVFPGQTSVGPVGGMDLIIVNLTR